MNRQGIEFMHPRKMCVHGKPVPHEENVFNHDLSNPAYVLNLCAVTSLEDVHEELISKTTLFQM